MSEDLFSLTAPRGLKSSYSRLTKKKEVNGSLSKQDEEQLQENINSLKAIAENHTSCDHGTIGDRWTYGILMEALKTKGTSWVVCMHKFNQRSISCDDADSLSNIEAMFPGTG
jgi:hypothetical protein